MLHLNNVQFLSPHSSPSSFPSKFSTVPFPTPIRRRTSSSPLRFRSFTRRLRNLATNDVKLNETEQKKPVNRAYPFHEIEPKWQLFWDEFRTFRTPDDDIDTSKPKYYILDMFPYPRFLIEVTLIFQFLDLLFRIAMKLRLLSIFIAVELGYMLDIHLDTLRLIF